MITKTEFEEMHDKVKNAVVETIEYIRSNCIDHNYVLLLGDGEYKETLKSSGYNPYVIDNREDRYKDESR